VILLGGELTKHRSPCGVAEVVCVGLELKFDCLRLELAS